MSFPESVAIEALTLCGRCCCICHKFCGTKIELHHIEQKAYGGDDTLENCIPLCFDCHSEMGKTDPKHPKGKRYSTEELKRHRDNWYKKVNSDGFSVNNSEKTIFTEDTELFRTICAVFTPTVKRWLIEEDIGGAHPYNVFHGVAKYLHDIYDDPFSEFIDPELEKMRGNLISSIKAFLNYKSMNTFVKHVFGQDLCVTRAWMVNHEDWIPHSMSYEEYSTQYAKEAQTLNDLATDVWKTYCEFVRQCRLLLSQ